MSWQSGTYLSLGKKQCAENTSKHEESEDLQNVLEEHVLATNIDKPGKSNLGNDGAQLA